MGICDGKSQQWRENNSRRPGVEGGGTVSIILGRESSVWVGVGAGGLVPGKG